MDSFASGIGIETGLVSSIVGAFASTIRQVVADAPEYYHDAFSDLEPRPDELVPPLPPRREDFIQIPSNYTFYKYEPINAGDKKTQIRLVTISRIDSPIAPNTQRVPCSLIATDVPKISFSCKISVADLHDKKYDYDAVSYTWIKGFPRSIPALVDGNQVLRVNASLYACLQRLLQKRDELVLWWDQICVDQTSKEDKSTQVLLMRDIFSQARKTYIWLGESDDETETAVDILNDLLRLDPPGRRISENEIRTANIKASEMVREGFKEKESVAFRRRRAVGKLLNRPWFERAWIYQEAAMAPSSVVMVGERELDFTSFCIAVRAFCRAEQEKVRNFSASLTTETKGYNTLEVIQRGVKERNANPVFDNRYLQSLLCRMAGTVTCKKGHDRVYAFLGFQNREDRAITDEDVSYACALATVYNRTAMSLIKATQSLDILGMVGGDLRLAGLSSWAPDWRKRSPQGLPIYQSGVQSPFNASGDYLSTTATDLQSEQLLSVKGNIIDSVYAVDGEGFDATRRNKSAENFLQFNKHMSFFLNAINGRAAGASRPPQQVLGHLGSQADRERLIKVLVADGAFSFDSRGTDPTSATHTLLTDDDVERLLEAYDSEPAIRHDVLSLTDLLSAKGKIPYLREKMMICVHKRLFFCVKRPRLGLAPQMIRPGDSIAILQGSKVPIVLRRYGDGDDDDNDDNNNGSSKLGFGTGDVHYRVIGQCYLEDAMFGEEVNWDEKEADTFILR